MTAGERSEAAWAHDLLDALLAAAANGDDVEGRPGRDSVTFEGRTRVDQLRPVVNANAEVDWLVTNGDRVDAVLRAGEVQWRVVFASTDRANVDWINVIARPARFEGVAGGRLVVINGPSGAGKSTLMRALQAECSEPWVIFDEPEHIGSVQPGYLVWRDRAPTIHAGYFQAIAAMARVGNYVAVSAAGHRYQELRDSFHEIPTLWVGAYCDEDVLLQRERRSGRWGGIAVESMGAHEGWAYDLTFDTSAAPDPAVMAARIIRHLRSL